MAWIEERNIYKILIGKFFLESGHVGEDRDRDGE
jgi:hypothetical protein